MSFYQIDTNRLREDAEKLRELNMKLKNEKETLTAKETELKTMWEGEANNTFHQAFLRDSGQMEEYIEVINDYSRVMEAIAERYDNAEAKNYSIASNRTYV